MMAKKQQESYQRMLAELLPGTVLVVVDFKESFKVCFQRDQIGKDFWEKKAISCLCFVVFKMGSDGYLEQRNFVVLSLTTSHTASYVLFCLKQVMKDSFFDDVKNVIWFSDGAQSFKCKELVGTLLNGIQRKRRIIKFEMNYYVTCDGKSICDSMFVFLSFFSFFHSFIHSFFIPVFVVLVSCLEFWKEGLMIQQFDHLRIWQLFSRSKRIFLESKMADRSIHSNSSILQSLQKSRQQANSSSKGWRSFTEWSMLEPKSSSINCRLHQNQQQQLILQSNIVVGKLIIRNQKLPPLRTTISMTILSKKCQNWWRCWKCHNDHSLEWKAIDQNNWMIIPKYFALLLHFISIHFFSLILMRFISSLSCHFQWFLYYFSLHRLLWWHVEKSLIEMEKVKWSDDRVMKWIQKKRVWEWTDGMWINEKRMRMNREWMNETNRKSNPNNEIHPNLLCGETTTKKWDHKRNNNSSPWCCPYHVPHKMEKRLIKASIAHH